MVPRFCENEVKSCNLLPAAGWRTQLILLILMEPGNRTIAHPCTEWNNLHEKRKKEGRVFLKEPEYFVDVTYGWPLISKRPKMQMTPAHRHDIVATRNLRMF